MELGSITEAVRALPVCLERASMVDLCRLGGVVEVRRLAALGAYEAAGLHEVDGHRTLAAWLRAETDADQTTAARDAGRAHKLHRLPLLVDAVVDGRVSFGQLAVILARVLGAFVRVRRGDTSEAVKPDGRILRADDPAVVSVQNMDEFVQATDPALPQAELYRMWCELAGTPDADVRGTLAAVQDLVTRQVAQSTEVKRQNDEAHRAEMARSQGQLDAANAAWARFEADERTQRTYLTGLQDRAAKVSEVYQTL